jgi:hypothetical protein
LGHRADVGRDWSSHEMLGGGVGAEGRGARVRVAACTRISPDESRRRFSMGAQADRLEVYAASKTGGGCRRLSDQAKGPLGSCSMAF